MTKKIGWIVVIASIAGIALADWLDIPVGKTVGILFLLLGAVLVGVPFKPGGPHGPGPDGDGS